MFKLKRVHHPEVLSDKVYRLLRESIVKKSYIKGGDVLYESEVSRQLGVSRTPVREAFKMLALEGFLELMPNKSAIVPKISFDDVEDILQIRGVLEGLAASLAAKNLTPSKFKVLENLLRKMKTSAEAKDIDNYIMLNHTFHNKISQLCGNRWLSNMLINLQDHSHMFRVRGLAIPGRMEASLEEHQKIIEAIKERDPFKAEITARNHIYNILENIRGHMKEIKEGG